MNKLFATTRPTGRWVAVLALLLLPVVNGMAAGSAWWTTRGVVVSSPTTNNYAAVNVGQLKWFATNALNEFESTLPGGAGDTLRSNVFTLCAATGSNYRIVSLGLLKSTAKPFYDRLSAYGYAIDYPWSGIADDAKPANQAQLKQIFNISIGPQRTIAGPQRTIGIHWNAAVDMLPTPTTLNPWSNGAGLLDSFLLSRYGYTPTFTNGMGTGWLWKYFGDNVVSPAADPDGDGFTNMQEYWNGTNPLVKEPADPSGVLRLQLYTALEP